MLYFLFTNTQGRGQSTSVWWRHHLLLYDLSPETKRPLLPANTRKYQFLSWFVFFWTYFCVLSCISCACCFIDFVAYFPFPLWSSPLSFCGCLPHPDWSHLSPVPILSPASQLRLCSLASPSNPLHLSFSTPCLNLHSSPTLVQFVFQSSFDLSLCEVINCVCL